MLRSTLVIFAVVATASAQTQTCQTARAIFLGEKGPILPACQHAPSHASRPRVALPDEAADMSALMYYIELVKPGGGIQRVTTDRIFHSGERIRLHFESSIAGRLTIAQLRRSGTAQLLFPDRRAAPADSLIESRRDTVIPPAGYFRFDEETGTDRLIVVLTPTDGRQVMSQTDEELDANQTKTLVQKVNETRGLILETAEEQPGKPCTFAAAHGQVALEIRLKHQ